LAKQLARPEKVVKSAMTKLAKNGKGILLMHDFQHATAEAMPELLRQLKAGGYKIVHMVPKEPATTLAEYDDMVRSRDKRPVTALPGACTFDNGTGPIPEQGMGHRLLTDAGGRRVPVAPKCADSRQNEQV
jgi:hypothetical protein